MSVGIGSPLELASSGHKWNCMFCLSFIFSGSLGFNLTFHCLEVKVQSRPSNVPQSHHNPCKPFIENRLDDVVCSSLQSVVFWCK